MSLPAPVLISASQDGTNVVFAFEPYVFPDGVIPAFGHVDGFDDTGRHVIGLQCTPDDLASGSFSAPLDPTHTQVITCQMFANADDLNGNALPAASSNTVPLDWSQQVQQAAIVASKHHGHGK